MLLGLELGALGGALIGSQLVGDALTLTTTGLGGTLGLLSGLLDADLLADRAVRRCPGNSKARQLAGLVVSVAGRGLLAKR